VLFVMYELCLLYNVDGFVSSKAQLCSRLGSLGAIALKMFGECETVEKLRLKQLAVLACCVNMRIN
jgi:hypothetical protein